MIINNIGTILYSLLNGKKIGEDNLGNKFFIHKKNKHKNRNSWHVERCQEGRIGNLSIKTGGLLQSNPAKHHHSQTQGLITQTYVGLQMHLKIKLTSLNKGQWQQGDSANEVTGSVKGKGANCVHAGGLGDKGCSPNKGGD